MQNVFRLSKLIPDSFFRTEGNYAQDYLVVADTKPHQLENNFGFRTTTNLEVISTGTFCVYFEQPLRNGMSCQITTTFNIAKNNGLV